MAVPEGITFSGCPSTYVQYVHLPVNTASHEGNIYLHLSMNCKIFVVKVRFSQESSYVQIFKVTYTFVDEDEFMMGFFFLSEGG